MTPQARAARAGIAGFLDALDPRVDTILTLQRADKPIPLKASHLRLVLAALDETQRPCSHTWNGHIDTWREEQDRPIPPDTGKLCCCHTGQDCPACLTGRCWECPDNPERERDEDRGDDEDEEWGEDD